MRGYFIRGHLGGARDTCVGRGRTRPVLGGIRPRPLFDAGRMRRTSSGVTGTTCTAGDLAPRRGEILQRDLLHTGCGAIWRLCLRCLPGEAHPEGRRSALLSDHGFPGNVGRLIMADNRRPVAASLFASSPPLAVASSCRRPMTDMGGRRQRVASFGRTTHRRSVPHLGQVGSMLPNRQAPTELPGIKYPTGRGHRHLRSRNCRSSRPVRWPDGRFFACRLSTVESACGHFAS
jgi:hypothetical protein